MPRETRNHVDDLRGATRLAVQATRGVTDLVEAMHQTIGAGPAVLGRPLERPVRVLTAPVYAGIRGTTRLVGAGIDLALAGIGPLVPRRAPGKEFEAVLAAVNGVLGDYLAETRNPLAIRMGLYHGGHRLEIHRHALRAALPGAGRKLLVLVHGSCMNDAAWNHHGHDHGAALARDLGYTQVYLRYNSGLHISTNGGQLSALLERLVAEWPAALDELVLLGHSMGGLVSRSACHVAETAGHRWRQRLTKLVCIASPHHGAPLERGGSWVDVLLGVSRYSRPLARLGKIRSAGVTDLRFGYVLDEHWEGRDRFRLGTDRRTPLQLPEGVECYAIAGTRARQPGTRLPDDGLVPVDSALGRHKRPELTLAFPETHQWIGFGIGHVELLGRIEVYDILRGWLSSREEERTTAPRWRRSRTR
ncbi:MAG TPA: alpha/beta hydrolase [Myxococcaceae bacterium]|nr:alpha/beta hydrolase [Myxococcaceae bacterium]